ncbi:MAG TPA: sugar ABC transporter substrate-binding protein, partial [Spirochaetia bacterium]|nr:sugar ABC transporter substrate-binding protein [Spirochaetia bacterium]
NPDAAFKALSYLLTTAAPDLLNIYGGMPAKKSAQADFLTTFLAGKFPGKTLNKDVIMASLSYPDVPNHESYMPSFQEATTVYTDFWNNLINDPKFDLKASLPKLQADLDKVFKAMKK